MAPHDIEVCFVRAGNTATEARRSHVFGNGFGDLTGDSAPTSPEVRISKSAMVWLKERHAIFSTYQ